MSKVKNIKPKVIEVHLSLSRTLMRIQIAQFLSLPPKQPRRRRLRKRKLPRKLLNSHPLMKKIPPLLRKSLSSNSKPKLLPSRRLSHLRSKSNSHLPQKKAKKSPLKRYRLKSNLLSKSQLSLRRSKNHLMRNHLKRRLPSLLLKLLKLSKK